MNPLIFLISFFFLVCVWGGGGGVYFNISFLLSLLGCLKISQGRRKILLLSLTGNEHALYTRQIGFETLERKLFQSNITKVFLHKGNKIVTAKKEKPHHLSSNNYFAFNFCYWGECHFIASLLQPF